MSGFQKVPGKPFKVIVKDPAELLDYKEDFSAWLATTPTGVPDTITGTPVWVVPSGLTVAQQLHTTQDATIWISGGTVDTDYEASCTIQTPAGRICKRSMIFAIRKR